jgi:hypothetical protein
MDNLTVIDAANAKKVSWTTSKSGKTDHKVVRQANMERAARSRIKVRLPSGDHLCDREKPEPLPKARAVSPQQVPSSGGLFGASSPPSVLEPDATIPHLGLAGTFFGVSRSEGKGADIRATSPQPTSTGGLFGASSSTVQTDAGSRSTSPQPPPSSGLFGALRAPTSIHSAASKPVSPLGPSLFSSTFATGSGQSPFSSTQSQYKGSQTTDTQSSKSNTTIASAFGSSNTISAAGTSGLSKPETPSQGSGNLFQSPSSRPSSSGLFSKSFELSSTAKGERKSE